MGKQFFKQSLFIFNIRRLNEYNTQNLRKNTVRFTDFIILLFNF